MRPHLLDAGAGHVERADRLGLVEHVLDGLGGERVEGEVDLLDLRSKQRYVKSEQTAD